MYSHEIESLLNTMRDYFSDEELPTIKRFIHICESRELGILRDEEEVSGLMEEIQDLTDRITYWENEAKNLNQSLQGAYEIINTLRRNRNR